MQTGGPRHDLARFGMEKTGDHAAAGRPDDRRRAGKPEDGAGDCGRSTTRCPTPKWVIAMGVCASSGGMFNNYAVVQGVDHIVPVDIYLPGCPPRPEMLMDAILKLHDQIHHTRLGANRDREITELEHARLRDPGLKAP